MEKIELPTIEYYYLENLDVAQLKSLLSAHDGLAHGLILQRIEYLTAPLK